MSLDRAYWTEVAAIFDAVVDLDDAERAAVLDDRCANRSAMRAEIEQLLMRDALEGALVTDVTRSLDAEPRAPAVGSTIGSFHLMEVIGVGGTGTVYRAQRSDEDFSHQVAVKIIASPVSQIDAARRFRAERQILASLRHPHIVMLLDGGVTDASHAYLIMEYVDGVPISRYCQDHQLSLPDRLHLFRLVCSAVHYAHRHSVVHRDLKPANILVTAERIPKVLDFGIAKLLDRPLPLDGTSTGPVTGPLTPNYASPEQLRGLPVTSSSDVYALGVLLYELLSDRRPYETEGKPLDEIMRLVVNSDPPRPSARPSENTLPYPALRLKGDLDAIILKAMAKEPDLRYGSAEELSEDIKRFITGVPVIAQEPSFAYLGRKLALRHKAVFITSAISLLLVVGALVFALWQAGAATAEKRRAEVRFAELRQLANALIFEIHDAVAPLPGSTAVRRTIVARALGYLERLAKDADQDAALRLELVRAYIQIGKVQGLPGAANLGDREGAVASFRTAQVLIEPLTKLDPPSADVVEGFVEATRRLSETLTSMTGHRDEAIREAEKAVAIADGYHRLFPTDVKARNLLASSSFTAAFAVGYPHSLPHWQRVSLLYDALLVEHPEDPQNLRNVALVEKYLGTHYEASKDLPQALMHYTRARTIDEKRVLQSPSDRGAQGDVAIDLSNEASVRWKGRDRRAGELFEASLALRMRLAADDPKDELAAARVAFAQGRLANFYEDAGEPARALEHGHAAMAFYGSRPLAPSYAASVAYILATVARVEEGRGNHAAGCAAYEQSFDAFSRLASVERESAIAGGDPMIDVARRAAACGVKAARDWLDAAKPIR